MSSFAGLRDTDLRSRAPTPPTPFDALRDVQRIADRTFIRLPLRATTPMATRHWGRTGARIDDG